ncbi:MAG: sigma-70 family RNA polymerase sigma factor [Clostridia bacterium]|nr:sigma-70 family RNA polymerase sigma factor [Clostridia bacterium]
MQGTNKMRDQLIGEFAENYMEKLFYFCLKKTGNHIEAEDLTQDIALQIITALNRGTIPTSFSAWVWQIARNRYSVWAKEKHSRNESVTGSDIDDYEMEDESENILDEMIHTEQMALLRRELAFIKSDYRNIVVAYYIENKSVRDIASSLSISISAVQQRLHRARIILKEGMDMAREFGVRSYKPEEIDFSCSCDSFGNFGQPWTIFNHKIYKNIFLEAYGNPTTAEELSLELGVALPYMEDELRYLVEQTMLVRNGNKYETAFPILSSQAQEKIWAYNDRMIPQLTGLFTKLIDNFIQICEAHGINCFGKYQTYEDAKWTLLMHAFDILVFSASPEGYYEKSYTKRPDGGCWDIVGYQKADIPDIPWVGLHGCLKVREDQPAVYFQQFKYKHDDICMKTPEYLTYDETLTLKAVVEGKWEACETYWMDRLLSYGYIIKTETGYEPTIIVFKEGAREKYLESFTDEEKKSLMGTATEIKKMLREVMDFSSKIIVKDLPDSIASNENLRFFALQKNGVDRRYVLEQALKDGWLIYDDKTSPVIGAYIYL